MSSGEYGDHVEKMVAAVDNGRLEKWEPPLEEGSEEQSLVRNKPIVHSVPAVSLLQLEPEPITARTHQYKYRSTAWDQFRILMYRMMLQTWRNSVTSKTRLISWI